MKKWLQIDYNRARRGTGSNRFSSYHLAGPFAGKDYFTQVVDQGDEGNGDQEWSESSGPNILSNRSNAYLKYCAGELKVATGIASHDRASSPQTVEKRCGAGGSGNLGIRLPECSKSMGVTTCDLRLPPAPCKFRSTVVAGCGHLSVDRFDRWYEVLEETKVPVGPPSRETGKYVIDTEENFLFVQIVRQREQVIPASL